MLPQTIDRSYAKSNKLISALEFCNRACPPQVVIFAKTKQSAASRLKAAKAATEAVAANVTGSAAAAGGGEEEAIAALLHDAAEDHEGENEAENRAAAGEQVEPLLAASRAEYEGDHRVSVERRERYQIEATEAI